MGRTLATANQLVLEEQQAFADFRRALRREDQRAFDALFAYARLHTTAISQASHALPFESVLLAMLLELWKDLERHRNTPPELQHPEQSQPPVVYGSLLECEADVLTGATSKPKRYES